MAGSYEHCLTWTKTYFGSELLENMGDMQEAVTQMFFMINYLADDSNGLSSGSRQDKIETASAAYYECVRRERAWPEYMLPGITGF